MKSFFILLGANIRSHRGSLIGIAALAFFAALMLLCAVNVRENASREYNDALQAVDAKDLVAVIPPGVSDEQVDDVRTAIEETDGVESIRAWDVLWGSKYRLDGEELSKQLIWRAEDENETRFRVFSDDLATLEKNPARLEAGEVYMPVSAVNSLGMKLGSRLEFDVGSETFEYEVVGFIEEPWRGTVSTNPNMGFMCASDFDCLKQAACEQSMNRVSFLLMLDERNPESNADTVSGADASSAELSYSDNYGKYSSTDNIAPVTFFEVECASTDLEAKKAVKKVLESDSDLSEYVTLYLSPWEMEEYTTLYEQIISMVLLAFALVVLIVSLVFVGYAVSANVEASYKTYGILKAQGVTGRMMRALLGIQYAIGAFVGTCLGSIAALFLAPRVSALFVPFSGLAARSDISIASAMVAIIGFTAIVLLYASLKSRHVERISPLRALNDNAPDAYFGSILTRTIRGRWLGSELALRAISSKPLQYIGSAFMVCAITVFALVVVGLLNWANSDRFYETFGFPAVNTAVDYTDADDIDEVERIVDETASIEERHRFVNQYVLVDGIQIALFISDDASTFTSILEGRAPRYDNEVVFTRFDEETFGKTIGDTVSIEAKGNTREYLIVGIFQTSMDLGKCAGILRSGALPLFYGEEEAQAKDSATGTYFYKLADTSQCANLKALLEDRFEGRVTLAEGKEVISPTPEQISSMMLALITLIGVVSLMIELSVALMVSGRTFLNERRSLGIYRALGFASNELRIQFTLRLLFVALLGVLLGAILVFVFGDSIMGLLFSMLGISSFDLPTEIIQTTAVCLFVVITFCLFAWLASRQIRKAEVRDLMVE